MFDPDRSGGGGGGDPWTNHPLVKAVRAEVDRQNRLTEAVTKQVRIYRNLTIINVVVFGGFAVLNVSLALYRGWQ